jgi:hypothetical protein
LRDGAWRSLWFAVYDDFVFSLRRHIQSLPLLIYFPLHVSGVGYVLIVAFKIYEMGVHIGVFKLLVAWDVLDRFLFLVL